MGEEDRRQESLRPADRCPVVEHYGPAVDRTSVQSSSSPTLCIDPIGLLPSLDSGKATAGCSCSVRPG